MNKYTLGNFKKVVLIFGMHRSGTSCLAGTLQSYGLHLGNVNEKALYNSKGNREYRPIFQFHNKCLQELNSDWKNPVVINQFTEVQKTNLHNILDVEYFTQNIYGIKDPRLIFTLHAWINALESTNSFSYFASIRHPVLVASSLLKRGDVNTLEEGINIWQTYNNELLRLSERLNLNFVNFNWSFPKYVIITKKMFQRELKIEAKAHSTFYEKDLIHNKNTTFKLTSEVKTLYRELLLKCESLNFI